MMISNTGPLVVLFKSNLLFVLKAIYQEVLVPETVRIELLRKTEGIGLFEDNPWIKVVNATNRESVQILNLRSRGYCSRVGTELSIINR